MFLSQGYDFSVDYWSLGVCLFEFLTGALPFGGENSTVLEIYANQIKPLKFPDLLADYAAKDLISRLLTFNPNDRLSSPTQIKQHQWFENFDFVRVFIFISAFRMP